MATYFENGNSYVVSNRIQLRRRWRDTKCQSCVRPKAPLYGHHPLSSTVRDRLFSSWLRRWIHDYNKRKIKIPYQMIKLKPIGIGILFFWIQSVPISIDISFEYSNGHVTFTEGADLWWWRYAWWDWWHRIWWCLAFAKVDGDNGVQIIWNRSSAILNSVESDLQSSCKHITCQDHHLHPHHYHLDHQKLSLWLRYGKFVASRPWPVIFTTFVVTTLCSLGWLLFRIQ